MSFQEFATAWDAIADTPAEAANLKARASLMASLTNYIKGSGWTQVEAARQLGITQPRVSDLARMKIEHFRLDLLVEIAARAGLHVTVKATKPTRSRRRKQAA
jgi:predicted XRE-type DNA-binding protein